MREIIFRGKSADNSKWVYGSYLQRYNHSLDDEWLEHYIVDDLGYEYEVIPETVGQFTGIYDKNGNKIFEGDRVKLYYYDGNSKDKCGNVKGIDTVVFKDGGFTLENETTQPPIGYDVLDKCNFVEVIGNIHEEVK